MERKIFIVYAAIVDANGNYNILDGYPKKFDSRSYSGDIEKTQRRAEGDMSEVYGAMCKQDTRQMQTVVLMSDDGFLIERKSIGALADVEPNA